MTLVQTAPRLRPACTGPRHAPDCAASAVLGIFRARAGRYFSQDCEPPIPGQGLELVISEISGGRAVSLVLSRGRPGDPRRALLEAALIRADEHCRLSLVRSATAAHTAYAAHTANAVHAHTHAGTQAAVGVGVRPLELRTHAVDAVRCAEIVFGYGDIEGEGPAEEFLFDFSWDGTVTRVHAWGVPGDPYTIRARTVWSARARVHPAPAVRAPTIVQGSLEERSITALL